MTHENFQSTLWTKNGLLTKCGNVTVVQKQPEAKGGQNKTQDISLQK